MTIELGRIAFSDDLIAQLKQDLRDDWFPDPLDFEDMIADKLVEAAITRDFEANHGVYVSTERTIFNLPKPDHTLRIAQETGLPDRAVYHGLISFLFEKFDEFIPWQVFNHRKNMRSIDQKTTSQVSIHNQSDRSEESKNQGWRTKGLFRSAIPVWRDFVGCVNASLTPGKFLVTTDIANYYEQIEISRLKNAMVDLIPSLQVSAAEKGDVRAYIDMLFSCLSAWSYSSHRGLPQNRDASSFLANIYMREVDLQMTAKGMTYFRYMDDIKIITSSEFEARKTLKDLHIALRGIGLSLNSKKTEICAYSEKEKIAGHLDVGDVAMQRLDAAWRSRSLNPIMRTLPSLKRLTIDRLIKGDVKSREFRFGINRITALASCSELEVLKKFFSEITDAVLLSIARAPFATDVFTKYLSVAPTEDEHLKVIANHLMSEDRNFYTWQNYLLWLLLVQKGFDLSRLLSYASTVVSDSADNPNRAGASLYIGRFGSKEAKEAVASCFPSLTSFLGQRCALIAVHELRFKPFIDDFVRPHVRGDLAGVYRSLHHSRKGNYSAKLKPTSILSILDRERDYV